MLDSFFGRLYNCFTSTKNMKVKTNVKYASLRINVLPGKEEGGIIFALK